MSWSLAFWPKTVLVASLFIVVAPLVKRPGARSMW